MDAARELFVGLGYEAASMRKIAEKVGVTATAIYTYFPDKEALLLEICNADFLALRNAFGRLARVADPVERMRRLGLAYVEFAAKNPNHYRLMFMVPHSHEMVEAGAIEHGNPDQDAYAFLKATVAECIAAGRFLAQYDDPDTVAQMLWASVHGLVSLHLAKGEDGWIVFRPLKKTAQELIDVTLRGMLAGQG
ncbi:MAG: TetR/AcrR family transcriptional regulator [Isosphaeraceae bacterium]